MPAVGGAHQFNASILLAISPQTSRHIRHVGMVFVESREEPVGKACFIAPIILAVPCLAVVVGEEHAAFAAGYPTVGISESLGQVFDSTILGIKV